jgi:hypothetical protein
VKQAHFLHRPNSFFSESRFDDLCRRSGQIYVPRKCSRVERTTYLFGGGEDILLPPSDGLLSPTDIFLASIDCIFPVATLSLRIVSSAGAVLNWIKDCRRGGSDGRRVSGE